MDKKKAYYYLWEQEVIAKSKKRLDIKCHTLIYDDADAGKVGDKVIYYEKPPPSNQYVLHEFVKDDNEESEINFYK